MVELEARPPVGGAKQSLNRTGQVDEEVAHEEEPEERQRRSGPRDEPGLRRVHLHGEDGSHGVDGSHEDADLADQDGEQQPPGGLAVGLALTEDLRQAEADEETVDEGQNTGADTEPSGRV